MIPNDQARSGQGPPAGFRPDNPRCSPRQAARTPRAARSVVEFLHCFACGPGQTAGPHMGPPGGFRPKNLYVLKAYMGPAVCPGPHAKKCKKSATDRGSGTPREGENRDFRAENPRGTLRRPAPIIWYHFQPEKPTSNHVR